MTKTSPSLSFNGCPKSKRKWQGQPAIEGKLRDVLSTVTAYDWISFPLSFASLSRRMKVREEKICFQGREVHFVGAHGLLTRSYRMNFIPLEAWLTCHRHVFRLLTLPSFTLISWTSEWRLRVEDGCRDKVNQLSREWCTSQKLSYLSFPSPLLAVTFTTQQINS